MGYLRVLTKAAFSSPAWAQAFGVSTVLSFSLSILYLFRFFFFLTKQISNKAAVADMQMLQGGIAASKGVETVQQRDVLAGVAL